MNDMRACFDFEIEFSNGGGIQGQGFRLDIAGDDVSDDLLAAQIISDLRLLMVSEVRILNKVIIAERHKRSVARTPSVAGGCLPLLVELSHVIESGMITYKGLPAPLICDHLSRIDSRQAYAPGTEFQIDRIEFVGNTGTYLDSPYHRYADGADLSELDLHQITSCPGVVVRVEGAKGRAIDWHSFAATDVEAKAVLVHTGWDLHWRTDQYFEEHPYLTAAAAEYLRDHGAKLVGIDSYNIDNTDGNTRPVHSVLLGAGIPIVEHLTNLASLPAAGFRFSAVPPRVRQMGTFPVRAHAIIDT